MPAVLLVDLPENTGEPLHILPAHLGGVVRRPVIDDQDIHLLHQCRVDNEGIQALVDVCLDFIDRNDDGQ